MTTKERTDLRQELVSSGYSWDYIDEWPSKTTLYWHRDNGVKEVGQAVSGVPGNPDYVSRKARIGLLQWPPSEACTCRWCMERKRDPDTSPDEKIDEVESSSSSQEKVSPKRSRSFGPHFQQS
jgi:hypothetical protein|tara:strand:+ start:263 stop:631 length:369 start_codon:yes stop_codon:yes gene_type:complete